MGRISYVFKVHCSYSHSIVMMSQNLVLATVISLEILRFKCDIRRVSCISCVEKFCVFVLQRNVRRLPHMVNSTFSLNVSRALHLPNIFLLSFEIN